MQPKFITFEGGEGCGKSTQIKLFCEYLSSKGFEVVQTREPGGTPSAENIRELLVSGDKDKWTGLTEIMLHYAARVEHTTRMIKPSLQSGKIVVSDRYFDSTIAYQGYGHGESLDLIADIQKISLSSFGPDITFVLDIEVEKGLARAGKRFEELQDSSEDRYESMGKLFHEKVRKGFLEIAEKNPKRCVVINADDSIENIHRKIVSKFEEVQ